MFLTRKQNQQKRERSIFMPVDHTTKRKKNQAESEVRVVKRETKYSPDKTRFAKFVEAGRYITVTYQERPTLTHIKKIDKKHYKVKKTGEIKEYQEHSASHKKMVRINCLRRAFDELKQLIRHNFEHCQNRALFVTLTYDKPNFDHISIQNNIKCFLESLKRKFKQMKFEYIYVVEPHGSGAWHIHVMLKADIDYLYIADSDIRKCWKKGITTTQRLKSDDIGQYYTAYFTDLLDVSSVEDTDLVDETALKNGEDIYKSEQRLIKRNTVHDANGKEVIMSPRKKELKGSRLKYYPKGMKLYRCSKGIERPEAYMDYLFAIDCVENKTQIYQATYDIIRTKDNKSEVVNTIQKTVYRLRSREQKCVEANDTMQDNIKSAMSNLSEDNIVLKAQEEIYEQLSLLKK